MDATYIPSMNSGNAQQGQGANETFGGDAWAHAQQAQGATPGKSKKEAPVVGFLYTLSNNNKTEFWPLRIGANTVGSSAKCDVRLGEKTVSAEHCTIMVRLLRDGNGLIASIKDVGTANGTLVNGKDIGYDLHTCSNEDVITVGYNYRLVLLLVDPAKYGLAAAPDFQASSASASPVAPPFPQVNGTAMPQQPNDYVDMNETQADNPSQNPITGGGTAFMPGSAIF